MGLHLDKPAGGGGTHPERWLCFHARSAAAVLLLAATAAAAGPVTVTIAGGADASGHNYEWTITHDHSSPIVYVEFPHFRAYFFTPPPGWKANITHRYPEDRQAGECTAEVEDPAEGLKRGQTGRFAMRIGPKGAPRGEGDVIIRFADNTEVVVLAEVPIKESPGSQHVPLIALGTIFAVFLLVKALKRRKRQRQVESNAPSIGQ